MLKEDDLHMNGRQSRRRWKAPHSLSQSWRIASLSHLGQQLLFHTVICVGGKTHCRSTTNHHKHSPFALLLKFITVFCFFFFCPCLSLTFLSSHYFPELKGIIIHLWCWDQHFTHNFLPPKLIANLTSTWMTSIQAYTLGYSFYLFDLYNFTAFLTPSLYLHVTIKLSCIFVYFT